MLDDSVPLRKQFNTIFSGLDAKGLKRKGMNKDGTGSVKTEGDGLGLNEVIFPHPYP